MAKSLPWRSWVGLKDRMSPIHEEILKVLRNKGATYAFPICSDSLGEALNLNPSYVREQVRILLEKNLVGVRRGRGGGYFLTNYPKDQAGEDKRQATGV